MTEAETALVQALKRLADAALTAGMPRHAPAFQAALDAIDEAVGTGMPRTLIGPQCSRGNA